MKLSVNEFEVYLATGGQCFNSELPTVLFLHGSGLDNQSWHAQAHWFANSGFSVLVPDFPGHSRSKGNACQSIQESAQWLADVLRGLRVSEAHVIGHSQGFLSALELAILRPNMVKSLVGVASAAHIAVNPMLIESASTSKHKAVELMLRWGFGKQMQIESNQMLARPIIEAGREIMINNPLEADLNCCANYSTGLEVAAKIQCPAAMILAEQDKMTPLAAGLAVAGILNAQVRVLKNVGHMLPLEAPQQVLAELKKSFIDLGEG